MSLQLSPILEYGQYFQTELYLGKGVIQSLSPTTVLAIFSNFKWSHLPNCLVWVPPKAAPLTKTWEHVIYLGDDSRKYCEEARKWRKRKDQCRMLTSRVMWTTVVQSCQDLWQTVRNTHFRVAPPEEFGHLFVNLHLSLVEGCSWDHPLSRTSSLQAKNVLWLDVGHRKQNSGVWGRKPSACVRRVYLSYRWLLSSANGMCTGDQCQL